MYVCIYRVEKRKEIRDSLTRVRDRYCTWDPRCTSFVKFIVQTWFSFFVHVRLIAAVFFPSTAKCQYRRRESSRGCHRDARRKTSLTCTRGSTASSMRSGSSAHSFCTRPLIIKSRGWILFTALHATCTRIVCYISGGHVGCQSV